MKHGDIIKNLVGLYSKIRSNILIVNATNL